VASIEDTFKEFSEQLGKARKNMLVNRKITVLMVM
jgi:hypothetical protein